MRILKWGWVFWSHLFQMKYKYVWKRQNLVAITYQRNSRWGLFRQVDKLIGTMVGRPWWTSWGGQGGVYKLIGRMVGLGPSPWWSRVVRPAPWPHLLYWLLAGWSQNSDLWQIWKKLKKLSKDRSRWFTCKALRPEKYLIEFEQWWDLKK